MNISYALMLGMKNAALAPGSFGDPRVTAILDSIDMQQYLGGELPEKIEMMRGKMMFKMLPMATAVLQAYLRPKHILQQYRPPCPKKSDGLTRFQAMACHSKRKLWP